MARWMGLALAFAVAFGAVPSQAAPVRLFAQTAAGDPAPGTPKAIQLAKKHFERARAAYGMGSYKTAVEELNTALEYDPNGKDLVYNLGLVHEKLGNIELAIGSFKRYVEMETDAKERERVEQMIQRLEGAREEIAAKEEPVVVPAPDDDGEQRRPTSAPADRDEPSKGRLDGWVYATGGIAVAAAVVGTIFGLRALSTRPSSSEGTGPNKSVDQLREENDQAHSYAVVADVAFAVSLVSAGAAGFLYFSRDAETTPAGKTGTRTLVNVGVRF